MGGLDHLFDHVFDFLFGLFDQQIGFSRRLGPRAAARTHELPLGKIVLRRRCDTVPAFRTCDFHPFGFVIYIPVGPSQSMELVSWRAAVSPSIDAVQGAQAARVSLLGTWADSSASRKVRHQRCTSLASNLRIMASQRFRRSASGISNAL